MKCRKFSLVLSLTTNALALCLCAAPRSARADDAPPSDNVTKARALFSEGRKLVQDGNYEQACPKFAESLRLNDGIGTQFNLADCWEHIGRTASAQSLFLGAAASAHAAGQAEREQVAKARADALEPRLLHLLIDVRAADPELTIHRNQVEVKRDSWNAAVPVDPGMYAIEASAPGKKTWAARVSVPANASEAISVTVPPLEDAAAACEKAAPVEAVSAIPPKNLEQKPVSAPPLSDGDSRSTRRTAYSLALGGFGVAALGVGTVLALEYKSKNDDARAICPSGFGCSSADIDRHSGLVSDAKTFRTWSFVGFGLGGAAVVGAAVLYFAPSSSQRASGFSAAPFVTADGSWGAVASGKF